MPTNVTYGSCVEFTVIFLDASQGITVPSSGSLSIVYTSITGSTASISISLVQSGGQFVGNWDTSSATKGLANYSVTAPGTAVNPAASGQLRII